MFDIVIMLMILMGGSVGGRAMVTLMEKNAVSLQIRVLLALASYIV